MSTSFAGVLRSSPAGPALLPLLGSTAILSFDLFEALYFSTFVRTSDPEISDTAISAFWDRSLPVGLSAVFGLYGGTAALGGFVWSIAEPGSLLRKYAGYGALFTASHFIYGYTVARVVEKMVNQPALARSQQVKWLQVHALRTLTSDIPGFLAFLACVWHGWD